MAEDASRKPVAVVAGEAGPAVEAAAASAGSVPAAAILKAKRPAARAAAAAPSEEEKSKVVHLVRRLQEEAGPKRAGRKAPFLIWSLLALIALPTAAAALYFGLWASDRYVSEARFAIRSNEPQAADALGLMTGMPSSTVISDSYIVTDYIGSVEMVETLERRLPLREIYSDPRGDWFARLDPGVTREELAEYWNDRIDVYFDSTKNTVAVAVQAFAPEHAEALAGAVVETVQGLVNDLSAQARRDAVRFAASELARAELRVRGARDDMLKFRLANNDFDPAQTAAATLEISTHLQGELSKLNAQLAAVSGYLSAEAPSVQRLTSQIAALEGEIARVEGQISETGGGAGQAGGAGAAETGAAAPAGLANAVAEYQELLLNQEFAEKAYTAALASMERAKTEVERTQSYLAIYMHPSRAEEALYPNRILNILVVFILAAAIWALGAFGFLTVKDHMN